MSLFFINLDKEYEKRFDQGKFFEFVTDNFDPLTSTLLREIRDLPLFGRFNVSNEEGRPDLVSFRVFGDTQYWWALMVYNDITKVDDVINGTVINYPSLASLEDLFFSLKARQSAAERDSA